MFVIYDLLWSLRTVWETFQRCILIDIILVDIFGKFGSNWTRESPGMTKTMSEVTIFWHFWLFDPLLCVHNKKFWNYLSCWTQLMFQSRSNLVMIHEEHFNLNCAESTKSKILGFIEIFYSVFWHHVMAYHLCHLLCVKQFPLVRHNQVKGAMKL